MRFYETLRKGDVIYTNLATMLVVKRVVDYGKADFEEYAFNSETNEFDILQDDRRTLTKREIMSIMHEYDGHNHFISLELKARTF